MSALPGGFALSCLYPYSMDVVRVVEGVGGGYTPCSLAKDKWQEQNKSKVAYNKHIMQVKLLVNICPNPMNLTRTW